MSSAHLLLALAVVLALPARADDRPAKEGRYQIDDKAGELKLLVRKKGALKAFAHDHDMIARVYTGTVLWVPGDPARSQVELKIATDKIEVLDEHASASDRAKITKTMQSDEVLDVAKFPEITFASQSVVVHDARRLGVFGKLTLHGVTRQTTIEVGVQEKTDGTLEVTGAHVLKQSEFGIEPYSTALGSIGVQDDIDLSFRIVARRGAP